MALTPKQEAFCLAYIETGNASEAYRRAYDCGGSKESTVNRNAKAMLDSSKIAARLEELRKPAVAKAQRTLERHLERLEKVYDAALEDGQLGAAVSAEVATGKALGFYVEKHEHSVSMTLEQLVAASQAPEGK